MAGKYSISAAGRSIFGLDSLGRPRPLFQARRIMLSAAPNQRESATLARELEAPKRRKKEEERSRELA